MLKKGEVKMIHKMLKDGLSKSAIARKLGINRDTVAKYAKLPEGYIPVIKKEAFSKSIDNAKNKHGSGFNSQYLGEAIYEGAVQRVRPKLMTVFSIIVALIPIMYINGVGSEVMQRIAAPMLGGVISSAVLSLVIIPILFEIYAKKQLGEK